MRNSLLAGAAALALTACNDTVSPTMPGGASRIGAPSAQLGADRQNSGTQGAVFTETNAVAGNAVVAFARAEDGSLTYAGSFPTGGNGIGGTNDPLASQYSLILSDNAKLLFVVNAGSNTISTFRVDGASLSLVGTTSSRGELPTSLAIARHTLYVLNANSNTVSGFDISESGALSPNAQASSPLAGGAIGGAAVRASRDGKWLVVTEKGSKSIDVFSVSGSGALGAPVRSVSSGVSPFGFDFVNGDQIAVSEAGSAAASLYDISKDGSLNVESASVSTNGQAAPCWLITTASGRFAYTANAGSGTISGYSIGVQGGLTLINASGVTGSTGAGTTPLDLDLSRGDKYLYVLESSVGRIGGFAVGADGALAPLAGIGGLAANSGLQGIAVY